MSDVEPTLFGGEVGCVNDATGQNRSAGDQGSAGSDVGRPCVDAASVDLSGPEPVVDVRADADRADAASVSAAMPLVDDLDRRHLFGLDFVDAASLEPVLESLLERRRPADGRMETVLTPNVDIMVHLTRPDAEQSVDRAMFERSQYCLPDGQPIVLASRLLGQPLSARLTGSGLFAMLWPRLVDAQRSVFMVASSEQVVERLVAEYPGLGSTVAPMFDADDVETIDMLAKSVIEAATAHPLDFVIVGIGNPKDTRIAASILRQWPSTGRRPPTILAVGAAASMYVRLTKRAPEWVQRIGMEWFFRFCQEPRRLFHRYFVRDLAFVGVVWNAWRAKRSSTEATGDNRTAGT